MSCFYIPRLLVSIVASSPTVLIYKSTVQDVRDITCSNSSTAAYVSINADLSASVSNCVYNSIYLAVHRFLLSYDAF